MDAESTRALVIILYYIAAFVITGAVSAVLIALMYFPIANKYASFPFESRPLGVLIGITERVLYTSSVLLGEPQFVAVWLVLKMAGEYRYLEPDDTASIDENSASEEKTSPDKMAKRRASKWTGPSKEYTIALVGNAFSIVLGIGSGLLIQQLLPPFPSLRHWQLPVLGG